MYVGVPPHAHHCYAPHLDIRALRRESEPQTPGIRQSEKPDNEQSGDG